MLQFRKLKSQILKSNPLRKPFDKNDDILLEASLKTKGSIKIELIYTLGTGRNLNMHKSFRRNAVIALNVALRTFNVCPVSRGYFKKKTGFELTYTNFGGHCISTN